MCCGDEGTVDILLVRTSAKSSLNCLLSAPPGHSPRYLDHVLIGLMMSLIIPASQRNMLTVTHTTWGVFLGRKIEDRAFLSLSVLTCPV